MKKIVSMMLTIILTVSMTMNVFATDVIQIEEGPVSANDIEQKPQEEEKKEEAEDYDIQIARAKQEAAAYKAQIKQQNQQIRKIAEAEEEKRFLAQKAIEDAKTEKEAEK